MCTEEQIFTQIILPSQKNWIRIQVEETHIKYIWKVKEF
jgi:hypothetical protein